MVTSQNGGISSGYKIRLNAFKIRHCSLIRLKQTGSKLTEAVCSLIHEARYFFSEAICALGKAAWQVMLIFL